MRDVGEICRERRDMPLRLEGSPSNEEVLPPRILILNTLAFALSFAVWVIFGPSSRLIAKELHVSPASAAFLKSIPILVGSVSRIPIGILTDRLGARLMFPFLMLLGGAGALAVSFASQYGQVVAGGAVLGFVGATFAVGVQSVSSWSPKRRQGTALGIFGAGNVGTAITTFGLPLLVVAWGWRFGFRTYAAGMALMSVVYAALVRNRPRQGAAPTIGAVIKPLAQARTWRFGLYYMACFGTFVGMTLVLGDLYIDAYRVKATTAGLLVTTFTFTASLIRIFGGRLADRHGARKIVRLSLIAGAAALAPVCFGPPLPATLLLVLVAGLGQGIAMGATMKYVTEYFPSSVGAVGGIIGALGGVGGFFLPLASSAAKTALGTPFASLTPMIALIAVALATQAFAVRHASTKIPPTGIDAKRPPAEKLAS
jgi:NNP family nitrate/nitrite transporter-like MFS transporter